MKLTPKASFFMARCDQIDLMYRLSGHDNGIRLHFDGLRRMTDDIAVENVLIKYAMMFITMGFAISSVKNLIELNDELITGVSQILRAIGAPREAFPARLDEESFGASLDSMLDSFVTVINHDVQLSDELRAELLSFFIPEELS